MAENHDAGSLAEELRALMSDAESLLRAATTGGNGELPEGAQAALGELRARLSALENQVREGARDVDSYVRANPWQAVAVTAGVALLLGLLLARR
jgi:ElaB/YqjD/DUF883 family membrane-anchored ribosome-binding protein